MLDFSVYEFMSVCSHQSKSSNVYKSKFQGVENWGKDFFFWGGGWKIGE